MGENKREVECSSDVAWEIVTGPSDGCNLFQCDLLCLLCIFETYYLCVYYDEMVVSSFWLDVTVFFIFHGMCGMCQVTYTIQSFVISRTHNL